ncbi:MAG: 3-dehydroquinate synthase [Polyangiales bacterium]
MTIAPSITRPDAHVYRQSFTVRYDYEVHFVRDLFAATQPAFARSLGQGARFGVFLEADVARAFPELAGRIARYAREQGLTLAGVHTFAGGEPCKNEDALIDKLQRVLLSWRLDRHAYLVAIGGGALLDLAGFVAATFHRGVRHVRVPTTVLAQDDSGVGVKNGVNALGLKNLIGTFAPPYAVFNDAQFLRALPERERIAGLAEAVKVALIRDARFFAWLEANARALRHGDEDALDHAIRRCAELHMVQIAHGGDPFERGSARPLDYGHWAAHKLETLSGHTLRHGEAVALGLALDTRYAVEIGMLEAGADERVAGLLERLGFALWHATLARRAELVAGLEEFREHLGGELTITLLSALGVGVEVHRMERVAIERALDWLRARGGVA